MVLGVAWATQAIRTLQEWTSRFERLWRNQLQRVKERAEEKMKKFDETDAKSNR
jgi:hypothetical protein